MVKEFISLQPTYLLLRRAISEHIAPLVLVLGSGPSVSAGLPTWSGLRQTLQKSIDGQYRAAKQMHTPFQVGLYQQAVSTKDYWLLFKFAKDLLGPATFVELVKQTLDPSSLQLPSMYRDLFNLNPRGVVTLNLDRLTGRALSESHPGDHFITIHGNEISRKWQIITDERPYLVYLHGHITDSTTWVLDQDEFRSLATMPAHSMFLQQLYLNNTVLFVGVSADDIALSGALLQLRKDGFQPSRLFWLTSRSDSATVTWAHNNHVQLINYPADRPSDHDVELADILSDLRTHRSTDLLRPVPNVAEVRSFAASDVSRTPREVAALEAEDVRKYLSDALAKHLKNTDTEKLYDAFLEFCDRYNYPIQTKSFYRHTSPDDMFFDYKLIFPPMGVGNFGTVYQASAPDGSYVAVKIMHSNIMYTREMLGGFRRGSSSMKILTGNKVPGVVNFIESFEMPPTIVMEYVSGNSLEEIFRDLPSFPWSTKMKFIGDVANIVDRCHKLPEMVLHRDIKPSNIMVAGLDWTDYSFESVVVLDFDMSWHKGSSEKDVVFESRDDFGYLAPEQTDPAQAVTSRSTKVDSYGLGMTAYALLKGKHPIPNMPLSAGWLQELTMAAQSAYHGECKCLPKRIARTIYFCTKIDQTERLEFSTARLRIDRINRAVSGSLSIDIIAEEILAQVAGARGYSWDDVFDNGKIEFEDGVVVSINIDDTSKFIIVRVEYSDRGHKEYQKRNNLMGQSRQALAKWFSEEGNRLVTSTIDGGYLVMSARISINLDVDSAVQVAGRLEQCLRYLHNIS